MAPICGFYRSINTTRIFVRHTRFFQAITAPCYASQPSNCFIGIYETTMKQRSHQRMTRLHAFIYKLRHNSGEYRRPLYLEDIETVNKSSQCPSRRLEHYHFRYNTEPNVYMNSVVLKSRHVIVISPTGTLRVHAETIRETQVVGSSCPEL